MNGEASTLHATEPRHLPFGKLMDGNLQARKHLVVGGLANDIFRQVFIFQAVIDKVVGRYSLGQQPFDLINHTLFQTGL